MLLRIAIAAALANVSPAPQDGVRINLWRSVYVGMTAAEVQAAYPAMKGTIRHTDRYSELEGVQQVARCHPDVYINYERGLVASVQIKSRYRGFPKEACGDAAQDALISKYGRPVDGDKYNYRGLAFIERASRMTWVSGGVRIILERQDISGEDIWQISYVPAVDIGL